jgi:glycosyltransferase involved in cell wall biosynthesis
MASPRPPDRKLVLAAILPHVLLFGGVRRFFELGNLLIQRGHQFLIFTPLGELPDWFSFHGRIEKVNSLSNYKIDCIFFTQEEFLEDIVRSNARLKILYHVGPRVKLYKTLKYRNIVIFSNSTNMYELDKRKYGIETVKAYGGVHIPPQSENTFKTQPVKIMAYGRLARKGKGTSLVVKACEKLYRLGYNVELLLFDSPIDADSREKIQKFSCKVPFQFILNHPVAQNDQLFSRADVFVAAEKKGGWSNTAAEALASCVPLVGTKVGTRDFLIHNETGLRVWRHPFFIRKAIEKLINNPEFARSLARNGRKKIESFSWDKLADFVESYVLLKTGS